MRNRDSTALILISLGMFTAPSLASAGVISWNTFLGGPGFEEATAIAADPSGNTYSTGDSQTGWGNPIQQHTATTPVFVAALDASGNLQWNTFLGGSQSDEAGGIATDGHSVYLCGSSLATWGAPVRAFGGLIDAFVAKMDLHGNVLWNTFLGLGPASVVAPTRDACNSVAVDASGNVVVAGTGIDPWGSPTRPYSGNDDGWVAKLDPNGNLLWNSFLGGSGDDMAWGVALDSAGNVYVTGNSSQAWGNPLQPFEGPFNDAWVARFDPNGHLVWSTFLAGYPSAFSIAVDSGAKVYVAGNSGSTWGNPVRPYSGVSAAFAAKLDSGGTLVWNTFLGGGDTTFATKVVVDPLGNLYVGGDSNVTWGNPAQPFVGVTNAYAARLDAGNGALLGNVFFGASNEASASLALDAAGNLYALGRSNATWGNPILPFSGGWDASVAQFSVPSCTLSDNCLNDQYVVQATYTTPSQATGDAHVVQLTTDTAYLWFFDPNNVEVVLKVIDGCAVNGQTWVFAGGLTNVEVSLTVTDSLTGGQKTYRNPLNTAFAPIQDTNAFACSSTAVASPAPAQARGNQLGAPPAIAEPILPGPSRGATRAGSAIASTRTSTSPACPANSTTLCLADNRFAVEATYNAGPAGAGTAQVGALTSDTGYLWFFNETNVEAVVKVINGCALGGHYWFFAGGLTDVGVTIRVTDTTTHTQKVYRNPDHTIFEPIQDTSAFGTCP